MQILYNKHLIKILILFFFLFYYILNQNFMIENEV